MAWFLKLYKNLLFNILKFGSVSIQFRQVVPSLPFTLFPELIKGRFFCIAFAFCHNLESPVEVQKIRTTEIPIICSYKAASVIKFRSHFKTVGLSSKW